MEYAQALEGLTLALKMLALPAVVFVLAYLALRRYLRVERTAVAIAAIVGFITGWAASFGTQASFPPQQTLDWLPLLVILDAALLAAVRRWSGSEWRLASAALAIAAGGLYLLTPPLLAEQSATTLALEWGGALALAAALLWAALSSPDRERSTVALAVAFGGFGFVTSLGGSLVIGGLANAAFAVAGAIWLGQVSGRLHMIGRGPIAAGVILWVWIAFSARQLAEIHLAETLLCAAGAAAAALILGHGKMGLLRRTGSIVLPPAVPTSIAVGLALWRYFAAQQVGY